MVASYVHIYIATYTWLHYIQYTIYIYLNKYVKVKMPPPFYTCKGLSQWVLPRSLNIIQV